MTTTSQTVGRLATFGVGFVACPLRGTAVHISRCLRCPDVVDVGPIVEDLPAYIVCDPTRQSSGR